MAPTGMRQESEEPSGSRSRAGERRRRSERINSSSRAQSLAAPSSKAATEQSEGERSSAADKSREDEKKRHKRSRAADKNREDEKKRARSMEAAASASKAATEQSEEERSRAADKSREDEKKRARSTEAAASASDTSSTVSSPLRAPCIGKREGCFTRIDPAIEDAYEDLLLNYHEKRAKQLKLVTMYPSVPRSCMMNTSLIAVRESATETILEAAKVLFSLSSYVDGEMMAKSSGFLIDWDVDTKVGIVLTSALLICTKSPSLDTWLPAEEYVPNAEVRVHLLDKDEMTTPGQLLHYDKHFKIALFKVHLDSCAKITTFNNEVRYGQEVFVLGRDKDLNLIINHGGVEFVGPTIYRRHHYMSMGCIIDKFGVGGPVIDFNGQVLGMVGIPGVGFVHSFFILKCLDMWKKFEFVPRLHTGMKFSAMKFLDPAHAEKVYRKCKISSGLIVKEVSHGSVAEKSGIRIGDIIVSINGECITTTVDLEKLLLLICEDCLDRNIGIGSSIEIPVPAAQEI